MSTTRWAHVAPLAAVAVLAACTADNGTRRMDDVLVDLSLHDVSPVTWVPGTRVAVTGDAFVDDPWGTSRLRLQGASDRIDNVDVSLPLTFTDFARLDANVGGEVIAALGGTGAVFEGTATVEVLSAVDGSTYASTPVDLALTVADLLTPRLDAVPVGGLIFPNEAIELEGADLLLPGEGDSVAVVQGCFATTGSDTCEAIAGVEVPIEVRPGRDGGSFAFSPRIAGIVPGSFEGQVSISNRHQTGNTTASASLPLAYELTEPILYGVSTDRATLGQFVDINGAGFIGNGEGDTLLSYIGTFTPVATGIAQNVDVVLLPEFVDGRNVRYVVSETDGIGQLLNVRFDAGTFQGMVTPRIAFGDDEVFGDPVPFAFSLEPVKQVVHLQFLPSYTESLRHFGLRAADQHIRERVYEVLSRDFATVNVDFRDSVPTDYALFAQVELAGPDPNGLGLLGYDNTSGKDTENQRLYDRIGGVNALTQEDGFPGYGGVFIESLLGYSSDPAGHAETIEPNEDFDAIFDPFRVERGGTAVAAADLAGDIPRLTSGDSCPVLDDRRLQLACAIWALGSMVGSTVSHEIGHSLGLADPYGPAFHNQGDAPDRLMDADRPFAERAQLRGMGPSLFCVDEYDYLRAILPTSEAYDATARPVCF